MTQTAHVLFPTSAEEAAAQFGDGSSVTVIGGGTVVVPELTSGRRTVTKALLLARAGLDTLDVDGGTVTVGAGLPVARLASLAGDVKALAECALNVADHEIRRQATVGGNLCAGRGPDTPRGDLQGPFVALDATARSTGAGGEVSEPLEAFLARARRRLLLDVRFEKPAASAFAALEYPHTQAYTALAVTGVRTAAGETRLVATGVAGPAARLRSAEAAAGDPAKAGAAAVEEVEFADDAIASAWYRRRTLPVLVRRVLVELEEDS
jgi:CO/xanthine dehydrogenase FAD-binding subunit